MTLDRKTARKLEGWYAKHHRPLPWRETRDPYSIWISEVMLQQTQVNAVIPYYQRFLGLWPTVGKLAKAKEAAVFAAWSGLGYYSRARNLMKGAQFLEAHHGGTFPRDRKAILATPGIGPYTAGAILSIAFNLREPLVDGNVIRVFARYFGEKRFVEDKATQLDFWDKARAWVEVAKSPREFNQALMELGALICTKGQPKCAQCPLVLNCYAYANEAQAVLPRRKPKRKAVDLKWVGVVLEWEGKLFLRQNTEENWWTGLWDFPYEENAEDLTTRLKTLQKKYPEVEEWNLLAPQKHTVTHHRIEMVPVHGRCARLPRPSVPGKWWTPKALKKAPVSSLVKKVLSSYESGS